MMGAFMDGFRFDLQLFAETYNILAGESQEIELQGIGAVTYTATADATITVEKEGEVPELVSGAVRFDKLGARLIANGLPVKHETNKALTVNVSGENFVTIAAGGDAIIGVARYNNVDGDSAMTVFVRTIEAGQTVTNNGVDYTATEKATLLVASDGSTAPLLLSGTVTFSTAEAKIYASKVTMQNKTATALTVGRSEGKTVVTIAKGGSANIGGYIYTASADAAATFTKPGTNNRPAVLTSGALTVSESGALIAAKGVTVENKANANLTVDATGDSAAVTIGTSGSAVVTIEAGKSATIDGATYTNTGTSDATITKADGGTATLTSGEVSFNTQDASLVAKGVTVTNTADTALKMDVSGDAVAVASDGSCTVKLDAGKIATVNGKTYMNTLTTEATITVENGTFAPPDGVLPVGEAIVIEAGTDQSVTIKGVEYTNTSSENTATIVLTGDGDVELTAGSLQVPDGGSVILEPGVSVVSGGATITNTSSATSDNTIIVGGSGVISRIDDNATCEVSVPQGKSIVFGANKFTVVSGPATSTFTADADYAPTLTSDSVVRIDTPCGLKAKGVEVTNRSAANATIPVTVDATGATGDYAKITTADGGVYTVSFLAAGAQVKIDGTLYTNALLNPQSDVDRTKLTIQPGQVKLDAGAVTIGAATLKTGNSYATITNKKDNKITVDSGSNITNVEDGAEFDVTISNTSVTVEGKSYVTTAADTKFTAKKSGDVITATLTTGSVEIPDGGTILDGSGKTYTAQGGSVTLTATDGTISAITDIGPGETLAIGDKDTGEVTEYSAYTEGDTTKYRKAVTDTKGGTKTTYVLTPGDGGDVLHPSADPTLEKYELVSAFAWPDGENVTGVVCYAAADTSGMATVRPDAVPTMITVESGKTYAKATVTKAGKDRPAVIALTQVTAGDMTLGDPGPFTGGVVTVDAKGENVFFTNKNGLAAVVFTNVGEDPDLLSAAPVNLNENPVNIDEGSVILDANTWGENDKVTTAALGVKSGYYIDWESGYIEQIVRGTVTVGGQKFQAGADGTVLVIEGRYEIATDTYIPVLKSGTVFLDNENKLTLVTEGEGVRSVVTYHKGWASGSVLGVNVVVEDGKVTAITGMHGARSVIPGFGPVTDLESVTIETTVGEKTSTITYEAKYDDTNPDLITVTRIDKGTGAEWQCDVSDSTTNLLKIPESQWMATNLITTQDFDWDGVGYFRVGGDGAVATVQKQAEGNTISGKSDQDKIFLKVVAETKDGVATISSLGFVKVLENGIFVDTVAPQNCKTITIDSAGLTGVDLPKHAQTAEIVNAAANGTFTGLDDADTVSVSGSGKTGTLTVNKKTFAVAATDEFTVTGAGTIESGVFTVTDSATAAAIPPEGRQLNKTVKYEYDKAIAAGNGVEVTADDWGFERITGLEAGETVTVTSSAKGNGETITAEDAGDGKTTVRLTETYNGLSISYTQTGTHAAIREKNVNAKNGYTVASLFDFGAAGGEIGVFACTGERGDEATVAKQAANDAVTFGEDGKKYLVVAAKKSGSMATITNLLAVSFDQDDLDAERHEGGFKREDISEVAEIFIEAPENMGLTLSKAVDTARLHSESGYTFPWSLFHVTGAKAGQSYLGFGAFDQISASLKAGEKIIVGATKNTAKTITAKEDCETVVCGNGRIVSGIFAVGNGIEMMCMGSGEFPNYAKLTAPSTAVATIEMGEVVGLKGLAAGKKAVIKVTDYFGAVVSTVEYAAATKANTDGTLTVTRTTTADGLTTIETAAVKQGEDVYVASYKTADASINSTFDWVKMNSGYFKTELAAGDMTKFGDVKVEPTTTKITKDNAGEIYLKAEAGRQLRLQRVKTDGTMEDVHWADNMTGTLTLVGMMGDFDRDEVIHEDTEADPPIPANVPLPAGVKVAVVDAATYYSELYGELEEPWIANLKAGDTVTTTKLAAGETITVNGAAYTMGAADLLRVEIEKDKTDETKTVPVLYDGTLLFDENTRSADKTVITANGSYKVTHDAGQKAVVKVRDGEVVSVSGLTGEGLVSVTDGNGNQVEYSLMTDGRQCVNFKITNGEKTIQTVALEKGTEIIIGASLGYAAGGGALRFYVENSYTIRLVDGTLLLERDGTAFDLWNGTATTHVKFSKEGGDSQVLVTAGNGEVTSITGLRKGDIITVGDTTYKAETDTIIKRWTGDDVTHAVTTYLSAAGGDVLKAADTNADISDPKKQIEGQFSWKDVSGRSTGYFAVTEKKDNKGKVVSKTAQTISEQSSKSAVTVKTGTEDRPNYAVYVMANTVTQNDGGQELTIGALKATNDGTATRIDDGDAAALLDKVNLTVTAPAARLTYSKQATDKYHITLNKVAANSDIRGLAGGDKAVTASLAAGEQVYMQDTWYCAGAKGTLTFQGEGKSDADPEKATNKTTLLSGTILLRYGGTALLSGSTKADDVTDNIMVVANGQQGNVTVAVKNGGVNSITGLTTKNAYVTITQADHPTVTYKVLSSEAGPIDAKTTRPKYYNIMVERAETTDQGTTKTYASLKSTANLTVTTDYKKATGETDTNTATLWTGATEVYLDPTTYTEAIMEQKANVTLKADDVESAVRGKVYYKATVSTAANGLTTISKVAQVQINAQGVPQSIKGDIATFSIDGMIDAGKKEYAKIKYTIPAAQAVFITNAGLGSVFTGVTDDDSITTAADGSFTFDSKNSTVTVYNDKDTAVYECKTKGVTLTMDAGTLKLTEFKSGTLTVTETTAASGKVKTEYVWKGTTLMKTVTAENGAKEVYKSDAGGKTDDLTGIAFADATIGEVVSDFNWTLTKNKTGYFATATKNGATSATAQTAKTTVTSGDKNSYIAVTLLADGEIAKISQTAFVEDKGMEPTEGKFTGTLTIKGAATALTFDRAALDEKTIDTAAFAAKTKDTPETGTKLAVTNAAAGSTIKGLAVGDTMTTAKLALKNTAKGIMENQAVVVSAGGVENVFRAGAANTVISVSVQELKDLGAVATVTGGTLLLDVGNGVKGDDFAYVGTKLVTAVKGNVTVAVSKSGTKYNIGGLTEGVTFIVEDTETGVKRTYQRSATTLFCTTETKVLDKASGNYVIVPTTSVYSIGTKTSITSDVLDAVLLDDEKKKQKQGWTTYTDENKAFNDDNTLVSGKTVTVDLATLDKRIAADGEDAGGWAGTYQFVIDKYMAAPAKFAGAASVIQVDNRLDVQQVIGSVANNYVYKADLDMVYNGALWNGYPTGQNIAQTIKAADKWEVHGGDLADTIVGAAKGNDTLIGGLSNDTLVGGGANDTFLFFGLDQGVDTIKSYATGKDEICFAKDSMYKFFDINKVELEATTVGKSKSADVRLDDDNNANDKNSVLLTGMGNGKAVTIRIQDSTTGAWTTHEYYFGSAVSTKGMTFTFADGAYYVGKAGTTTANTLAVGTDATKATAKALGDTRVIDLSDTTHYRNINAVDASKSGNAVIMTASGDGSTLKGGTYQSTLKGGSGKDSLVGGSGADTFWFDTIEKDDVVTGYASGKDSVYLGDVDTAHTDATMINGYALKADGTNVVLSNVGKGSVTLQKAASATKAITVRADADGTEKLSYYVGSATKASSFTATVGKDVEVKTEGDATTTTLTSYYVGGAATTDKLTISGKSIGKASEDGSGNAVFDLGSKNLSGIELLDTSGVTATAQLMSYVTLKGKDCGTFTLSGSTSANVKETFDLKRVGGTSVATATVKNLGVGDVIEIAAGAKASVVNNVATLTWEASGSTITLTGIKDFGAAFGGKTEEQIAAGGKFERTK